MFGTSLFCALGTVMIAIAIPIDLPLSSFDPAEEQGDFQMYVVKNGDDKRISVVNEQGEFTAETINNQGFEIEKPANEYVCYVRGLDEEPFDENGCVEKIPVAEEDVPATVVMECDGRPMFALEQCVKDEEKNELLGELTEQEENSEQFNGTKEDDVTEKGAGTEQEEVAGQREGTEKDVIIKDEEGTEQEQITEQGEATEQKDETDQKVGTEQEDATKQGEGTEQNEDTILDEVAEQEKVTDQGQGKEQEKDTEQKEDTTQRVVTNQEEIMEEEDLGEGDE